MKEKEYLNRKQNGSEQKMKNANSEIEKKCRICYEDDTSEKLIKPCKCDGSIRWVHPGCLKKWISISKKTKCPECRYDYKYEKKCLTPRFEFLDKKIVINICSILILSCLMVLSVIFSNYILKLCGKRKNILNFSLISISYGLRFFLVISIIILGISNYFLNVPIGEIFNEANIDNYSYEINPYSFIVVIYYFIKYIIKSNISKYITYKFEFSEYAN